MKTIEKFFSIQGVLIFLVTGMLTVSRGYCEKFSFVVIADPHIDGNADRKTKLETVVDWIINNKNAKYVELVAVVGDIAWGGSAGDRNLEIAKDILDNLNKAGVPYIPLIGDNEVQTGCEKEFNDVFRRQYQYLSKIFENWRKAPVPVNGKYLQNFSFDYKDCHFICADFGSRKSGDEGGELHDFPGGTWPWLKSDIEDCSKPKRENIVIMTHIGMFRTGFRLADQYLFSKSEMNKIKIFLYGHRKYIDSNYAGHIHQNWHAIIRSGLFETLYHVRVTDETWYDTRWPENNDQKLTVRWIFVNTDGPTISYAQHIEDISKNLSPEKRLKGQ